MESNPLTDAILLLNVSFTRTRTGEYKPLTPGEYAKFASWLKDRNLTPADLLSDNLDSVLEGWTHHKVTRDRIAGLLQRGGTMGFAMEKWRSAGLWVLTRNNDKYPARLKKRLRYGSPPVLFGCGRKSILADGGIAVVGSRNATRKDLEFCKRFGTQKANEGRSIISGGARGVDRTTMLGALNANGTAIGIMVDSILRHSSSRIYRKHIEDDNLVLLSPFNPEARWMAYRAMSRNKFIYCMADEAVVVASTPETGGTWSGAKENLRNNWIPLWVKRNDSPESGNSALVALGAKWLPEEDDSVQEDHTQQPLQQPNPNQYMTTRFRLV